MYHPLILNPNAVLQFCTRGYLPMSVPLSSDYDYSDQPITEQQIVEHALGRFKENTDLFDFLLGSFDRLSISDEERENLCARLHEYLNERDSMNVENYCRALTAYLVLYTPKAIKDQLNVRHD